MKKGFTLIEMIAVILIIAMISITMFPLVMNQLQSQKNKMSETSKKMILTAADLYVSERSNQYPKSISAVYCGVTIKNLVEDGKLKEPLKDFSTGKELDQSQVIKVTINSYGEYEYDIVEPNNCIAK